MFVLEHVLRLVPVLHDLQRVLSHTPLAVQHNTRMIDTYRDAATGHGGRVRVRGARLALGRPAVDALPGVVSAMEVLERCTRQSSFCLSGGKCTYPASAVVVADPGTKRTKRHGKDWSKSESTIQRSSHVSKSKEEQRSNACMHARNGRGNR